MTPISVCGWKHTAKKFPVKQSETAKQHQLVETKHKTTAMG